MIDDMARIIQAEASVLDMQGKLGVAQCICDNRFDDKPFAPPADHADVDSMQAAEMAVYAGARRLPSAKILQFRSFARYGPDGVPDMGKIYGSGLMPDDLLYLGKDSLGQYGHYYFGRWVRMKRPFKLLIMAGHGRNVDGSWDPGACGCGYQEADLTRELSSLIVQRAKDNGIDCDLAPDRNHYSFFKSGGQYDVTAYNYVLEVHFNASTVPTPLKNGEIKGSMCYIDQDETGHSVEDAILSGLYDIGSRQAWDGVVITQRQWPNGLMVQRHVREQGVSHAVLETCFISDGDDMAWYQGRKELIATKIVEGIIKGFKLADDSGPNYEYCGRGVATAEALEEMNIRIAAGTAWKIIGTIAAGQRVEVLRELDSGWLKIVWPGDSRGYAFTSNAGGKYYKII